MKTLSTIKTLLALGLSGALGGVAADAKAAVVAYYDDAAGFTGQGAILQTTDFDAYVGTTVLGPSTVFGDFTLTANPAVVVHKDDFLNPVRSVVANDDLDGLTQLQIDATGYNMIGFKLGNFFDYEAQVLLILYTNLGSYAYGLYPDPIPEHLSDYGFVASPGEYFTKARFNHTELDQGFGLTDIQLGRTPPPCGRFCGGDGPVPEPSAWALMILGFGGVGMSLRTRRRLTLLHGLAG
jgi:hypothetical protein